MTALCSGKICTIFPEKGALNFWKACTIALEYSYAHNHRFATVTGDAIPCEGSHVHEVKFKTDSCNGHHHEFCGTTEKAVDIGCGKHIHLLKGCTSYDANHKHEFIVSTDMENPICK